MNHAITLILGITIFLYATAKFLRALTAVVSAIVSLSKGLRALWFGEQEKWHAQLKQKNAISKTR